MTKRTKNLLIIGGILIIVGLVAALIGLISIKFDFSKLDRSSYVTNNHVLNDSFDDIIINSNTADIEFFLSTDGQNKVECFESEKEKHQVIVSNNKLEINVTNKQKWYDYIGFNFKTPTVKIYLNKNTFNNLIINEDTGNINISKEFCFTSINIKASTGNVICHANSLELTKIHLSTGNVELNGLTSKIIDIDASTGDICLNNIISSNIKINLSTGKTTLTNVQTNILLSDGSTGDIILNNVIGSKFMIERSTGDVKFNKSDAQEIYIETDTGDVDLPSIMSGGKCVIETDTGDIKISIEK